MGPLRRLLACGLFIAVLSACATGAGQVPPREGRVPIGITGEEAFGIRVTALRWSAEGYMLDFRYRVIDPVRSAPLFDRSLKPYLVDEATGARLLIPSPPKVGPLRQMTAAPEAGRVYFILFANPGKYLKPGDRVSVAFGEHRLEHLIIE